MELTYLPDSIARYTYNPWHVYPDWEDINSHNNCTRKQYAEPRDVKTDEKTCSICRQNRKRLLSIYIKNKHRNSQSTASIKEEKEEDEKEPERQDKAKPD